jgi:hypothetical protein
MKDRLKLNNYSMMFNDDGYLLSIKRHNQFLRFKQVDTIRDLINNLERDNLTLSDLRQVLGLYSNPIVSVLRDRILIENIIM